MPDPTPLFEEITLSERTCNDMKDSPSPDQGHWAFAALEQIASATASVQQCEEQAAIHPHPPALGRNRQISIALLVILGNLMQYSSMFSTVAGGFEFSARLGRGVGPGQANWMAAAFSLTQSSFVLISGRFGAVYGHQRVLLLGGAILAVFSLVNAFCSSYESFIAARALTGIGGGIIMPNAVAVLTIMVPPGPARNLTLAVFAASPPIGATIGALLAGAFLQHTQWKFFFVMLACVTASVFVCLWITVPRDDPVDPDGPIDYVGAGLGLGSLALFNFAWNQAPSAGWQTPYIPALAALSIVTFASFLQWERKYATEPIMPLSVFAAPTFNAIVVVVLFIYMSVGIALWYMVAWQQLLRGWSVLRLATGWIPYSLTASAAVGLAAWLIPRLAAQWILAIGVTAQIAACLLLATMPEHQVYWAQTFPAIMLGGVCPDFVYVAAQVITSDSVGKRHQGVAGSLVGTLNLFGNSLGLGFAGTIETQLVANGSPEISGFRAALYFGAALAIAGLILDLLLVRSPHRDIRSQDTA